MAKALILLAVISLISARYVLAQDFDVEKINSLPDLSMGQQRFVPNFARTKCRMLTLEEARFYMLRIINRDRASMGLRSVSLDKTACAAAQLHTEEMAVNGYAGHWGQDGRKPDQRYTEMGGRDCDAENASGCRLTRQSIQLSSNQLFSKEELEETELAYFGEKPPNDGHRKNIINAAHTGVGIGLAEADGNLYNCQEFTNHYGEYSDVPHSIGKNEGFTLSGRLFPGVHLLNVDVRREDAPQPMTVAEIEKTYSYSIPKSPTVCFFPNCPKSPASVRTVNGCEEFYVNILGDKLKPGLNYVLVWANIPGLPQAEVISERTFFVDFKK